MKKPDLPESFLDSMRDLLGDETENYINSFDEPCAYGLRVNQRKLSPDRFAAMSGFSLEPVPWIPNGFYYREEDRLSKHPYYYAGLYYLQEPSAMTPAFLLPVWPGDKVLDVCAAPGGKSTELGAKLQGQGMLLSNDISNSRAKALLKNLELAGIDNICVTSETPEKLAQAFPEYFDKILVDAPCSGEGMFRRDSDMLRDWEARGPEYYAPIQREILCQTVSMLKPDGYLLYSTCTFSKLEDEDNIAWLMEEYPQMELLDLECFDGAAHGYGLTGCLRLFPHKLRGEGHFIALLHKKGAGDSLVRQNLFGKELTAAQRKEVESFLSKTARTYDWDRIRLQQDMVYYLPEGFAPLKNLRYLRTGLLLGTMKKDRFEPSQALAMTLDADSFPSVSFSVKDDRVLRYLKGETIALSEDEKAMEGWCLVCVDGFALGFAKGSNKMLKNKYYPGWRWQ